MKKIAQYLAVILFLFLCTFGGADVDDLRYLLIVLGIAVVILITIIVLAEIDYRRHHYMTVAQIMERINYKERQKLIESTRHTSRI